MRYLLRISVIVFLAAAAMGVRAHDSGDTWGGGVQIDGSTGATVIAHTGDVPMVLAQAVVPEAEKAAAQKMMAEGPDKTSGIAGVNKLGAAALDGEFDSPAGLVLRAREIIFEPGGVVAVHQHDGRPGVAFIIEGELTEHRAGMDGPVVRKAGDVAFEQTGVTHWWKNASGKPARALVVDIVPAS